MSLQGTFSQEQVLQRAAVNDLLRKGKSRSNNDGFQPWEGWTRRYLPSYFPYEAADKHKDFGKHIESIDTEVKPNPFVAIWDRGGAKSTNCEAAVVYLGRNLTRKFALYVCGTQDQANTHVSNIADMIGSAGISNRYESLAEKAISRYGNQRGWKINMLRCGNGFDVLAVGLDKAMRGLKLDERRPDLIIFDDVDDTEDSPKTVEKKIRAITSKILPAGTRDTAVIFVQNLIHPNSIAAKLSGHGLKYASFLIDRKISGPYPSIENLSYVKDEMGRTIITGGTPTWAARGIAECQADIDEYGLDSFLSECQHDMSVIGGFPFKREYWEGASNRYDINDRYIQNRCIARFISFDTALKDEEHNSETAYTIGELAPDYRLVIRKIWHDHVQFPALTTKIEQTAQTFQKDGKLHAVIIEDKASGTPAIQTLGLTTNNRMNELIHAFDPKGSKNSRYHRAAVWCQRGCVLLPNVDTNASWLFDLEEQLYSVRGDDGEVNDIADSFAQLIIYLEHYLAMGWKARNGVE